MAGWDTSCIQYKKLHSYIMTFTLVVADDYFQYISKLSRLLWVGYLLSTGL